MATVLNVGKRLETIIDLCDKVKCTADVGCDHGYVASELILQYKSSKVIATDVSEESLNKAIRFCASIKINPYVSFRDGDGFDRVSKYDKVNQAVIAGMGGMEIISILKKCEFKIKTLVLQPMKDALAVRQYFLQNGYKLIYDFIIEENEKFYTVIKAQRGKPNRLNNLELFFGKDNFDLTNGVFKEYLVRETKKMNAIKEQVGELNKKYTQKNQFLAKAVNAFKQKEEQYKKLKPRKKLKENATKIFKKDGTI